METVINGFAGQFFCRDAMHEMVGTETFNVRERVWFAHSGRCAYCERVTKLSGKKKNGRNATIDHIIPISNGGANIFSNYTLACRRCNQLRSNMDADRFREIIRSHCGPIPEVHETKRFGDFASLLHSPASKRTNRRVRVYASPRS